MEYIKNKLNELLPYKFKVRIRQHTGGSKDYIIEYAYYRVIPKYKILYRWLRYGLGYNPITGYYDETKNLACNLKTYQDVLDYKTKQEELSIRYPKKKDYYDPSLPISIEQIL